MKGKLKKIMAGLLCTVLLCTNAGAEQYVYAAATSPVLNEETEILPEENNDGEKVDNNENAELITSPESQETAETDDEEKTLNAGKPDQETEVAIEETDELILATAAGTEVTRIKWLQTLVETFEMEVADDNYPDNYYTDITSASEDYRTVMLATEFGLIDVEAGDALCPEEAATREFAAHTLNLCLGFHPKGNEYSFKESEDVTYPDDIQVAIEQEWFLLSNGYFYPDRALNESEKTSLITYAKKIISSTQLDPEHTDQYQFAEGVIALSGVTAQMAGEEEYILYNCSQPLQAGDIFAVIMDGFPVVKKIKNIQASEEAFIVQTESVSSQNAFKSVDIQGTMEADLALVEAYDPNIELNYITGGTASRNWEDGIKYNTLEEAKKHEIDAVELSKSYSIPETVRSRFNLPEGITADITCTLSHVNEDHKIQWDNAYVSVGAVATFNCNVSMDVLQAVGADPSIQLAWIPVGGIGYLSVTLDLTLKGNVTFSLVEYVSAGIYCDKNGFRLTHNFYKESFTISAHAEASVGFTATAGIDCSGIVKGSVYGKVGVKTTVDSQTYDDGAKPDMCTHINSWLYALAGYNASADLAVYKDSWHDEISIFTQMNSPVRVSYHYEDGTAVNRCTRGNANRWKYYTPADSRYGYNGASGGTGANGEPFTIFEYTLDDLGNATITKYNGNVSALNIPETLDGHTVVKIDDNVFQNNTRLRMLIIPDSVTEIGLYAFYGCKNLANLKLSNNLVTLGSFAFGNCSSLTTLNIPKNLTANLIISSPPYRHFGPFTGCSQLKNITFEEGTTQIAPYLFKECTGLEEITIPDTVTTISEHAFDSATNLKSVLFGNAATNIGESAFAGCTALTNIEIPDSVTEIGIYAFYECKNLSNLKLPNNLAILGSFAFGNCISLTTINIPKSLTTNLIIANPPYRHYGPFTGCTQLKNIEFEEGTTQIAPYLFMECTGLEEITIPDTVTTISGLAFYSATSLKSVHIANSVVKIEASAFNNCTSLESIETPENTKTFGDSCFNGCTNLKSAVIHATKTSMGNNMFNGCTSLESVVLPADKSNLEEGMFRECISLKEIILSDTLQTIGNYAFYNCDALTSINIPEELTSIGYQAFYDCDALTAVHIPDSVVSLGTDVFYSCDALKDVSLGLGLSVISANTFYGCASMETIVIPYYVTELGNYSFKNCTSLTSVTMPRGLIKIGTEVFSYPRKMTIYGISGTYAEEYAKANNITFVDQQIHATAVEIPETLILVRGASKSLPLSVTPSNFTDEIDWKSTDENIVTVSERGTVTAKAIGNASVKVTVGDASAVCQITVVQPVTSIRVNPSSKEAEAADIFTLTADVYPADAYDKSILWTSSDETVAAVTSEGQVMALAKGTADIIATAQDGSGKSGSCKVTVTTNAVFTETVAELESPHPYDNNTSDVWVYTAEGAKQLQITFDEQTEIEDGFDYLYIYDADGNEIGKYTGKELAGKTITVPGNMVKIKLVTDKGGIAWGFKVTKITSEISTDPGDDPGDKPGNDPEDGPGNDPGDITYENFTIKAISDMHYTGKALKPTVRVYYGNTLLKAGKNYSIVYKNNMDMDQTDAKGGILRSDSHTDTGFDSKLPYVIITGKGNFSGTIYMNFHILPMSISDEYGSLASGFVLKCTDQFVTNSSKEQKIINSLKYKKALKENTDYTATLTSLATGQTVAEGAYLPAGSQGEFNLTITGKGSFTGTVEKRIYAADKDHLLKNAKITLGKNIKKQDYTGENITLVPAEENGDNIFTVKLGNTYLKYGEDYDVTYNNNIAVGTASMTVIGKPENGYLGTKSIKFQIIGKPFTAKTVTVGAFKDSFTYTGKAITQNDVSLTANGKALILWEDYRILYKNNIQAGTATITFEALPLSGYSGKFVKKFKIQKAPLQASMLQDTDITAVYTPGGPQPKITLSDKGVILKEGRDYTIRYTDNKTVGTASMAIKGKGNYGESFSASFTITPKNLSDSDITAKPKGLAYVEGKDTLYKPGIQLLHGSKTVKAKEYEITYFANTSTEIAAYNDQASSQKPVMVISAKSNSSYAGNIEMELPVYKTKLTAANIDAKVEDAVYTGSQVKPPVEVYLDGKQKIEGKDYVLTYGKNVAAGKKKGSVTITGLGLEYGGSVTIKFDINSRNLGK